MRIASLDPALTDIIISLGLKSHLVAVTAACQIPSDLVDIEILPLKQGLKELDLESLLDSQADIVCARAEGGSDTEGLKLSLQAFLPKDAKLKVYQAFSFDSVLQMIADLAKDLNLAGHGLQLANRLKAQSMDWGTNFYARTHNKKVSLIASIEPFQLYGMWVPDLVSLASANPQLISSKEFLLNSSWQELLTFRPDVILVAPYDRDLKSALSLFKQLEKFPDWQEVPAVKRGEVIFASGQGIFDRPSMALRNAMAIIFSAIAGFESGYITERDTFYRLRWIEMQRHRI